MKKVILIALAITLSIAAKAQEIGVTWAFQKNGIGLLYSQNCKYFSVMGGAEYCMPFSENESFRMLKYSLGASIHIRSETARMIILGTYSHIFNDKTMFDFRIDLMHKYSFEIGPAFNVSPKMDILLLFDPLNIEPRLGINLKF